jgi:hypothetical protein
MAKYFSPQGAGRNISPCHLGKNMKKVEIKDENLKEKGKKTKYKGEIAIERIK